LIAEDFTPLGARDVGRILQLGGTMLGSSRRAEFRTEAGVSRALESLGKYAIEGLVVIGGNGSQGGADDLAQRGFPVVGVASTIDNSGTDVTIGVDTALNIALEEIDRFRSHLRQPPGAAAADQLAAGQHGVLVGMLRSRIKATPLGELVGRKKALDLKLFRLAQSLAR
jgi:6-phosphofructokinase